MMNKEAQTILEKCILSMTLEQYNKLQYYDILCVIYFD